MFKPLKFGCEKTKKKPSWSILLSDCITLRMAPLYTLIASNSQIISTICSVIWCQDYLIILKGLMYNSSYNLFYHVCYFCNLNIHLYDSVKNTLLTVIIKDIWVSDCKLLSRSSTAVSMLDKKINRRRYEIVFIFSSENCIVSCNLSHIFPT